MLPLTPRYLNRFREPQTVFLNERAHEVSTEEGLKDKRCREIWVDATSRAAVDDRGVGDGDDACYRLVRWSYLSLALKSYLRGIQTVSSDVEWSLSSEDESKGEDGLESLCGKVRGQSLGCEPGRSFTARDLDDCELRFILNIVREGCKWSDKAEKSVDESQKCRIFTGYATAASVRPDKDVVLSLKEFRKFSKYWLSQVLATLSRMRKDWSIFNPVRVHGFVSRSEAHRQLLGTGLPGVFLLRFSESRHGRLVLSFTREVSNIFS